MQSWDEQVDQVLRTSTTVRIYAAGDSRVAQWYFSIAPQEGRFSILFEWEFILGKSCKQDDGRGRNESSEVRSDILGNVLVFHGTVQVNTCS